MYKQETIFYKDTFQIHITKDYVDNILIEEKHYTIDNKLFYVKDYIKNITIKRFYFHNEELDKQYDNYHYLLTIIDDEPKLKLYTGSDIHASVFDRIHNSPTYTMTQNTCTHLCTLDNNEAIQFIQNYIKIQILEE